jgi:hypothetical protein
MVVYLIEVEKLIKKLNGNGSFKKWKNGIRHTIANPKKK